MDRNAYRNNDKKFHNGMWYVVCDIQIVSAKNCMTLRPTRRFFFVPIETVREQRHN